MANFRKQRTTQVLPVTLTKKERLSFADELGDATKTVQEAEANKKTAKKQLDVAKDNQERLATIVSSGLEYRDVDVEECCNLDTGQFTAIRTDTGEVILERPLTELEKQTTLVGRDV